MFRDSSPTWVIVNQIRDGVVSKEAWLINAAYLNITAIVPTAETAKRADYSTEELVFNLILWRKKNEIADLCCFR